jgi:hypothetical protein
LAPGRPLISDEFKSTQPPLLEALNIEQQNTEPQNHEVMTSIFDIPSSIFCGLKSFIEMDFLSVKVEDC